MAKIPGGNIASFLTRSLASAFLPFFFANISGPTNASTSSAPGPFSKEAGPCPAGSRNGVSAKLVIPVDTPRPGGVGSSARTTFTFVNALNFGGATDAI